VSTISHPALRAALVGRLVLLSASPLHAGIWHDYRQLHAWALKDVAKDRDAGRPREEAYEETYKVTCSGGPLAVRPLREVYAPHTQVGIARPVGAAPFHDASERCSARQVSGGARCGSLRETLLVQSRRERKRGADQFSRSEAQSREHFGLALGGCHVLCGPEAVPGSNRRC
jgi:hypothetical protein